MKNPAHALLAVAASFAIVLFVALSYLILTQPDGDRLHVRGTGTIWVPPVGGCFYVIVGDDGQIYEPTNLDERFQVDGMEVYFEAINRDDLASTCMMGKIITIHHMEEL